MQRGKLAAAREQKQARPSGRGVTGPPPATGPGPALPSGPVGSPGARDKAVPRLCLEPGQSPIRGAEVRLHVPTLRPPGADPARSRVPAPLSWHGGAVPGAGSGSASLRRSPKRVARARPQPAYASTELPGHRCCTLRASCTPSLGHEPLHTPRCTQTPVHARLDARPVLHNAPVDARWYTRTHAQENLASPQPSPHSYSFVPPRRHPQHSAAAASRLAPEKRWKTKPRHSIGHSTGSANRRARPRPRCSPPPPPGRAQRRAVAVGAGTAGPGLGTAHSTPCFGEAGESQRCTNPSRPLCPHLPLYIHRKIISISVCVAHI